MSEPPSRKRFQIHLSTAIVLMFAAGGLIWAQVPVRRELHGDYFITTTPERQTRIISETEFMHREDRQYLMGFADYRCGWPAAFISKNHAVNMDRKGKISHLSNPMEYWRPENILLDALFALLVLWLTFRLCEWRIRRAARKES